MADTELVIFDCDGVLVDSEPPANRVFAAYLNEHGLALTVDEVMRTFVGLSLKSCVEIALDRYGVRLPDDFIPELRRRTEIVLAEEVQPVPHVRGAVGLLACATCVASSGEFGKMRLTLGRTGLLDLFEGRLNSATEVSRGKPAPDLFLLAAERMGVEPARCAVVEDSPFGIEAARAAGMRALGFCGGGHRDLERDAPLLVGAGADIVFDDMRRLPGIVSIG
ncbi:MAG: HAD family hydrolase [Minwuia sp.]|uniref:HAD family hydrolase n=1 Tax=Minwuia sp. TaxID=2493630 RepID=UPI003A853A9A